MASPSGRKAAELIEEAGFAQGALSGLLVQ